MRFSVLKRLAKLTVLLMSLASGGVHSETKNGFDLTESLVPANEILSGGLGRDGIPAIDQPKFLSAGESNFLKDQSEVLGITRNGVSKAYPIAILNWHEIVNDTFGDESIVITYCPLCGSGVAFLAVPDDAEKGFGVSGLLYNSDVLLYDRATESLWSQLMSKAVSGPRRGELLNAIPMVQTTWGGWRKQHPDSQILSRETGYNRDYSRDPYATYTTRDRLFFPVAHLDDRLPPKLRVLGIQIGQQAKAYPFSELNKTDGSVQDAVGGQAITVKYDAKSDSAAAYDGAGKLLQTTTLYWFAWASFHPKTDLFKAK